MPVPILALESVTKVYADGTEALGGVDLAIEAGETVAIVGQSGSGKTTLLRLFNRLVEPTSGEVLVDGHAVRNQEPVALRRRIGYVQQEGGLLPHWNVARNVGLVPRLQGWTREKIQSRVGELLTLVGLEPERHATRYPAQLSGGERQRVAFARALAADPPFVLMDEPFGALDALTRREMHESFLHLRDLLGKTMVLVTHDLLEALRLAHRVAVMRVGRVEQVATPEVILHRPATDYVARLLGDIRREVT